MLIQGIVRTVDDLGRICLPREYRQQLNIKEGQELEIVVINDFLVIGKARTEETAGDAE
jgi:AbrB family looped-hinge helix DNA binding protein